MAIFISVFIQACDRIQAGVRHFGACSIVDASDLTTLACYVAKIKGITDEELVLNADVNRDGEVSAADLTKLARFVAKIDTTL